MLTTISAIDPRELHALLIANGWVLSYPKLLRLLGTPSLHLVGVCLGGRLVGVAMYGIEAEQARLHTVDVLPQYRRQGIGCKLIDLAAAGAQAKGRYQLVASLGDPDSANGKMLLKAGFKCGPGMASHRAGLMFVFRRIVGEAVFDSLVFGEGRTV